MSRLLHEVEAGDAGFAPARVGIGDRGSFEGFDVFRFYLNLDVDDEQ